MSNTIVGLILLGLGLLFFLTNTGVIDLEMSSMSTLFSTYWPMLIILWGAYNTVKGLFSFLFGLKLGRVRLTPLFFGLLLVGAGVIIQGNKLDYFDVTFSDIWSWVWPTLIIYIGFQILIGKRHYNHDIDRNITSIKKEAMDDVNVALREVDEALADVRETFGKEHDTHKKWKKEIKNGRNERKKRKRWRKRSHWVGDFHLGSSPWELEDMDLWMGVGDLDLDLTKAILPEGEIYLDLRGWVGDITVLVPHDMSIKANAEVKLGDVALFNHHQSGVSSYASYISEDYQQREKKVRLTVSLSIGQVTVKHVE